ncbi:MAG: hypothetical protein ACE5PM_01260 [Candidatus Hydrothermarchaeales archaeon]
MNLDGIFSSFKGRLKNKFSVLAIFLIVAIAFFLYKPTKVVYPDEFGYPECSPMNEEKYEPLITVELSSWEDIYLPDWKMEDGTIVIIEDYKLRLWLIRQRGGVDKIVKICCFEDPFKCKTTKTPY